MRSASWFIFIILLITTYSHVTYPVLSGVKDLNSLVFLGSSGLDEVIREGDLIFHKSRSMQSSAIREATGSPWSHVGIIIKKNSDWYVVEARNGVEATLLPQFIERGHNQEFKILRFKYYRNLAMKDLAMKIDLHQILEKYKDKPYDIYFEFSDDRIYCSELTYKVMLELTGQEIGRVNKMKDLRLDGPYAKELIKRRLTDLGKELNLEEPIVTPISQMNDSDLEIVAESLVLEPDWLF